MPINMIQNILNEKDIDILIEQKVNDENFENSETEKKHKNLSKN